MSLAVLVIGTTTNLTIVVADARAEVSFSAGLEIHSPSDFYSPLGSYGTWLDMPSYGRCWHPARVEAGWRPYSTGHWEWTDCGWYWVSDEPWAWACYHYGSWTYDPVYGWIWIPGTEWAPAWVTWRESPDYNYVGWAPCGPGGVVLAPSFFMFVDAHHFHDRLRPDRLIVNNTTIINRTRVINNITRETRTFGETRQRVVINRGPGVDPIQRVTGTRLTPRPVTEVAKQTPVPETFRRSRAPAIEDRRSTQERSAQPTGREEQRIYRQPQQPPPTGREEPRIYHEAPRVAPQPPVEPRTAPPQVVPSQPPPSVTPPERTLPPTGRERGEERGRGREQFGPSPVPPPVPVPQPAPPGQERGKGQDRDRDRG